MTTSNNTAKTYSPRDLNAHKFVSHDAKFDTTGTSVVAKVMIACINKKLKTIDDNMKLTVQRSANESIFVGKGFVPLMGYSYDFRPYMHRYVVHIYSGWYECWGFSKTLIRKEYNGVTEIIEAKHPLNK